jgi:four helix bundle protein
MKVKDYKELKVWQKGIDIVDKIYSITEKFPKDEMYSLVVQMRRAAVSVPSNIAEGFNRKHTKEYTQFLRTSLGSCAELDTQLIITVRRKYISEDKSKEILKDIEDESRMLSALIRTLSQKYHMS